MATEHRPKRDPWAMAHSRGRGSERLRAILLLLQEHDPQPVRVKDIGSHLLLSSGYMSDLMAWLLTSRLVQSTPGGYLLTSDGREALGS